MRALLLACLATLAPVESEPAARVRLLVLADPGPVTLFVDGREVLPAHPPRGFSGWQTVAPGERNFKAIDAAGTVLDDRDTTLEAGQAVTLALLPRSTGWRFLKISERLPPPDETGWLRVVNLCPTPDEIIVRPLGDPPVGRLRPGQVLRPTAVDRAERRWSFETAEGTVLGQVGPVSVPVGAVYTLWLLPGAAGLEPVEELRENWTPPPPVQPVAVEPPPLPLARLRVCHLAPGTAALDGFFADRPLVRNVGYGQVTDYVTVTPGRQRVKLVAGDTVVVDDEHDFGLPSLTTLVVCGPPDRRNRWFVPSGRLPHEPPRLRLLSVVEDLPPVDLRLEGEVVARNVGYFQPPVEIPLPTARTVELRLHLAGQDTVLRAARVAFDAGVGYTLIIAGVARGGTNEDLHLKLLRDDPR